MKRPIADECLSSSVTGSRAARCTHPGDRAGAGSLQDRFPAPFRNQALRRSGLPEPGSDTVTKVEQR